MVDKATKEIWLRMFVFADDITRYDITHKMLLSQPGLSSSWSEVTAETDTITGRRRLCFDQDSTLSYSDRPSDKIPELVDSFRHSLWTIVTSVPPYRKYYLYLAPSDEMAHVLPQLASVYAIVYYLGSITRYRPQHFSSVLEGTYGNLVLEILTNQPNQFVYLLASEFARREVTRPAIV